MAAAADTRRADALQLIFSFFLAMLLVVLVGAGVWTFYPQPFGSDSEQQQRLDDLYDDLSQLETKSTEDRTPAQQAEINRIQDEIDELQDQRDKAQSGWSINTSIILITFATVLMAISLFLPEHLKVFSNGVLLGGLFTVLYGTGWSFAGGDSRARFFVILVAVLLAIAFGYLRFIRGRAAAARAAASGQAVEGAAVSDEGLAALAARVESLEARATAAAEALGGEAHRP